MQKTSEVTKKELPPTISTNEQSNKNVDPVALPDKVVAQLEDKFDDLIDEVNSETVRELRF